VEGLGLASQASECAEGGAAAGKRTAVARDPGAGQADGVPAASRAGGHPADGLIQGEGTWGGEWGSVCTESGDGVPAKRGTATRRLPFYGEDKLGGRNATFVGRGFRQNFQTITWLPFP